MSDEKTEEPTQKKLDDAIEKGQSPKSTDVNAAAGLLVCLLYLTVAGRSMAQTAVDLMNLTFDISHGLEDDTALMRRAGEAAFMGLKLIVPFVCMTVLVGIASAFAQVGLNISGESLGPDFNKINPAEGIKKIFSVRSLVDLGKMLVKAIALGAVLWISIRDLMPMLLGATYLQPAGIASIGWTALLKLLGSALLVFIIIGPVDFGIQKWMFLRDQKMSKDDIKREHKESEGDPQLKGERKQLAEEMATTPPSKSVPGATVVVTNPTHYAVALRYDEGVDGLPIVVAKGADAQARQIREIAALHRVPIVSNPPLARALFKVRLNDSIPTELFKSVAAVLRWVRNLDAIAEASMTMSAQPIAGSDNQAGQS